jgi:hypothetical protein
MYENIDDKILIYKYIKCLLFVLFILYLFKVAEENVNPEFLTQLDRYRLLIQEDVRWEERQFASPDIGYLNQTQLAMHYWHCTNPILTLHVIASRTFVSTNNKDIKNLLFANY